MLRMQERAFPGFKFEKFSADYASTHVAFGHWYPPLISNDTFSVNILFYFLCIFSFFYFKYKYS